MNLLITPDALAADDTIKIVDATYHALEPDRDALAEYAAGHVPGALYLDLKHLADTTSPWPSMAPPADQFARRMRALGLRRADRIVLYDHAAHGSSARAWWLFRLFGWTNVALLDGGIRRWQAEGRPIESGAPAEPGGGEGHAVHDTTLVRDIGEVRSMIEGGAAGRIVDARSAARFSGAEADPRPGVAAGHMPGARNLPYGAMFRDDGTWASPDAIRAAFAASGADLDQPIVTTCGSGITASILLFGLALIGKNDGALYDGSWSEWGAIHDTPKAGIGR